jgi:spermidine synthase
MHITRTKWFWFAVSFTSGLVGLGLEISASRLLAPVFGTSTVVWSSVIGVVLLALSAGYYVGGRLAERHLSEQLLLSLLLGAGLLTLCTPLLSPRLLGAFTGQLFTSHLSAFLVGGSFLSSVTLFGLPVFLLGAVSPYLLALMSDRFGHIGPTAGKLLAISTLGGLAGTFLPTLVLIPWVGTRWTITLLGLLLVLVGLPALPKLAHKIAALLLGVIIISSTSAGLTRHASTLAEIDTPYQHIAITNPRPGVRYMQFDAGFGVESIYDERNLATGLYYDYASVLPALQKPTQENPLEILIIGLAGGTIPRQLHALYGNTVKIDTVEIDAQSTQLAFRYMGISQLPLTIFTQDGRPFLASSAKHYDFIYVDAYQNELQIPWPVTTKEFWQSVHAHLTPRGMAAMNVAALGSRHSSLVASIANTEAAVFPFVYRIELEQRRSASNLLVMGNAEVDFSPLANATTIPSALSAAARYLAETNARTPFDPHGVVLTDDKAPLEWLMASDVLR